jgi:hypothetical protein
MLQVVAGRANATARGSQPPAPTMHTASADDQHEQVRRYVPTTMS